MELFSGKASTLKIFVSVGYVGNSPERAEIDHETLKFAS